MPNECLLGLALGWEHSGQGWGFPQNLVGSAYQEERLRESLLNLLQYCFCFIFFFFFLAMRQVGAYLLDQGSNTYPLHWKAKF